MPDEKPKATKPWQPIRLLEVTGKDPAKRYRWVSEANYDKWVAMGGVPVKRGGKVQSPAATIADGNPDSVIKKRSLILMEFPAEVMDSKRKYYEDMTRGLIEQSYAVENRYGSIEVKNGGE